MPSLAARQRAAARRLAILDRIADAIRDDGYPPSMTQLYTEFGVSPRQIAIDLEHLVNAGKIVRGRGSRAIALVR